MRAEPLHNLKHMRGEEDGCAAMNHALQHGFQGAGGDGVDALKRLVEKKDARAVDDGGRKRELFLHAVRKVGDELFAVVGEAHEVEQLGRALPGGGRVEAVHATDET